MNKKEKTVTAITVVGAAALVWWLYHRKSSGGNVTLHLNTDTVQYDVIGELGTVIGPIHSSSDVTLEPGSYTINMSWYAPG